MKSVTKNILLSVLCLLAAALVAFAFVRAAMPASDVPTGGMPTMNERTEPPARPGEDTTGEDDAPITDDRIVSDTETPPSAPSGSGDPSFGGELPSGGMNGGRENFSDGEGRGNADGRMLWMILAAVGSAAFTFSLAALIFTNRGKRKEKLTKGGEDHDTDLPL